MISIDCHNNNNNNNYNNDDVERLDCVFDSYSLL